MSAHVTYTRSNDRNHESLFSSLQIRNESACSTPTIHVNPLCASNKILVNKEKLNKDIRTMEILNTIPASERIYYNPKFLTKHVQNACSVYNNSQDLLNECHEAVKSPDSNIHINRNYLFSFNSGNSVKSSNYLYEKTSVNISMPNRGGIHINPKFIKNQKIIRNNELDNSVPNRISSPSQVTASSIKISSPIKKKNNLKSILLHSNKINIKLAPHLKSKYKYIKNVNSSPKTVIPIKNQNSSKLLCFKTKYSLKRLAIGKDSYKINARNFEPLKSTQINSRMKMVRQSSEFKKLSRTKLVRKSVLQSIILARRRSKNNLLKTLMAHKAACKRIPLKKKTHNISYFPKKSEEITTNNSENVGNFSFKRLGKMKIVRKSLLKSQIEARNQVRKQYLRDHKTLKPNSKIYISKFKLKSDISKRKYVTKRSLLKWKKKKQTVDTSRIRCKRTNSNLPSSKNLRKNNQPCPFYNRFGRCKGRDKGTCPKLHDPKYISICRKILQGECNAKDCLLSHDIRPGKMPTCHHYLAGLCTRPNCPFLHIKVNPKAPICPAFLQGFCPDVFNCLKRHEFICPVYAEKGTCPRGKSCTYPHRSPVIHSKLLRDDQKPLLIQRSDSLFNNNSSLSISKTVVNDSTTLECDNRQKWDENPDIKKHVSKSKKEFVKESFTRYFAINNTNESCDNEVTKLDENIVINIDDFR